MKQLQVPIDNEMNAIVEFDPTFRFTFSNDDLSEYHKGFVNWHKQPTIEISVVCEGAVDVYVLKQKKTVTVGEGFCIMPGCLHSICAAADQKTARYFTLIFHPEILYGYRGSYFENAYYRPFADSGIPLFLFRKQDEWTKDIFIKLEWIAGHCLERWDNVPPHPVRRKFDWKYSMICRTFGCGSPNTFLRKKWTHPLSTHEKSMI